MNPTLSATIPSPGLCRA